MSVLYFDLETQHLAQEVGGWGNKHRMKMSVGVVYNETTSEFKVYQEENISQLLNDLRSADLVIGFNLINFDYEVLKGYPNNIDFSQIRTFDIFAYIRETLGSMVSLDSIAYATLNQSKCGNGTQAIQWFRNGDFDSLIHYCKKDVEITRDIFYFGEQNRYIKYWDKRSKTIRRLEVEWAERRPQSAPTPLSPEEATRFIEFLEEDRMSRAHLQDIQNQLIIGNEVLHNGGGVNMSKVIILYTNWTRTLFGINPGLAPYPQNQYTQLLNWNELVNFLPLAGLGVYINGRNGDFRDSPFVFLKIMGMQYDNNGQPSFNTEPILTTTQSSQEFLDHLADPHFLFESRESNEILDVLNTIQVQSPPDWLALLGETPPNQRDNWKFWIGEYFKRLNNIGNNDFEDIVADIFRAIGFEVEQMGHKRPGAYPDGVLKAPNLNFAFVYDCKNSSNYFPIAGHGEAMAGYINREGGRLREGRPDLNVYQYFIAKSFTHPPTPNDEPGLTAENLLYILHKKLKLGNKFSLMPFEEAWRRRRIDKQWIDEHWPEN
jgi:DEAD/DEAH box helicase domain-containing protein